MISHISKLDKGRPISTHPLVMVQEMIKDYRNRGLNDPSTMFTMRDSMIAGVVTGAISDYKRQPTSMATAKEDDGYSLRKSKSVS